jgi:hypothetical protein
VKFRSLLFPPPNMKIPLHIIDEEVEPHVATLVTSK